MFKRLKEAWDEHGSLYDYSGSCWVHVYSIKINKSIEINRWTGSDSQHGIQDLGFCRIKQNKNDAWVWSFYCYAGMKHVGTPTTPNYNTKPTQTDLKLALNVQGMDIFFFFVFHLLHRKQVNSGVCTFQIFFDSASVHFSDPYYY